MPLETGNTELSQSDQVGKIPQPVEGPKDTSTLNLAAAALRENNVASQFYDYLSNPRPSGGSPDFDPETHVPPGYEPVAYIFANAHSQAEVEWIRQKFDREQNDKQTISQHGKYGLAASLAAGLSDPVTLASMAIPGGGESRLTQMGMSAAAAAVSSGAQEAIANQMQVSRTLQDSVWNVGMSAVAGGVLGAIIRPHVPNKVFEKIADQAHAELHGTADTENAFGPIDGIQRIVPENEMPTKADIDAHYESLAAQQAAAGERVDVGKSVPVEGAEEAVRAHLEDREDIPAETKESLAQEYATAAARKPDFDQSVREISQEIGAKNEPLIPDHLKGADRAAEKVMADYGGDASRLKDLTRATVILNDPEHAEAAIAAAKAKFGEPSDIRNSLKGEPTSPDGYRDVKMNFTKNGHTTELQMNVPEMLAAKQAAHPLYEQVRSIQAKALSEDRNFTPEESAAIRSLDAQQKQIYAEAWSFATKERNLDSDTNVPLWLKDAQLNRRGPLESHAVQLKSGSRETGTPSTSANTVPLGNESGKSISATSDSILPDLPKYGDEGDITNTVNPNEGSTVGAAAMTPEMRGESIARGAGLLSKTLGKVSPGARLMNSPALTVRKLIGELANVPETLTKNWDGIASASPIERSLWRYEGINYQGKQARALQFQAYKARINEEGGTPLKRGAFMQEISYAMRRGDAHEIPEVAQAAKDTRRIVFDPLKERAIKAGLLPPDVTPQTADSYLMRQYDYQKIRGNFNDWLDTLQRGFVAQGVDQAEARDIAYKVTRNVQGSERGTMDWKTTDGIVPQSGQLKERTLKLPDQLLERYLNSDIDQLSHSYMRSMAPEVEMTERFGSRDLKDQLGDMRDEYARLMEREDTDAGKAKLYGRMENDLRDLTAVRDRLYGIFGQPKDPGSFFIRAGRLLRSDNALRLLGAATLAHFPDVANVMMRYGIPNTMAAVGRVLTSPAAFNLTRSEAKRMGAGLDLTMNATAAMLGDYANHSGYIEQRVANKMTSAFTILTGETPLITMVQQLTSTMAQDEIIRAAQRVAAGGELSAARTARLAGAGIDADMLSRIAAEHEVNGAKVNGLNFGMSDKWADQEAAKVFESAVLRDAHSVTLRPGVGDTPLFMSTELGKTIRQFTTFGYAAQRGVVNPLMQGLSHGDPRAAQALLALVAGGTLSYVSKQTAAGQPIEPWNSPKFALEVLDKSNLMGWTSDVIFPALWGLGFNNLSRWSDRDPVETIGGPSAGTIAATYSKQLPSKIRATAMGADSGSLKRSDLHFIRRLMPGQNLWFARSHINDLEDKIGDAFDLQGDSNADRAAQGAVQ